MVNIEELQFLAFRAARFYLGGGPALPDEDEGQEGEEEEEEEEDEDEEEEGQEEVSNLRTPARYGHWSRTVT